MPLYFHHQPPNIPIQYPIPNPLQNPVLIQYVYLPAPPHSVIPEVPSLPSTPKSLPMITSIPLLNLKTDFYAWDEGVSTLLHHLGIQGHILDPSAVVNPQRPDLSPSHWPVLSEPPTPLELAAFNRWTENDNVARYVLIG